MGIELKFYIWAGPIWIFRSPTSTMIDRGPCAPKCCLARLPCNTSDEEHAPCLYVCISIDHVELFGWLIKENTETSPFFSSANLIMIERTSKYYILATNFEIETKYNVFNKSKTFYLPELLFGLNIFHKNKVRAIMLTNYLLNKQCLFTWICFWQIGHERTRKQLREAIMDHKEYNTIFCLLSI